MKCKRCNGDGWTIEHNPANYAHDKEGNCIQDCPIQVQCEYCQGTGKITTPERTER